MNVETFHKNALKALDRTKKLEIAVCEIQKKIGKIGVDRRGQGQTPDDEERLRKLFGMLESSKKELADAKKVFVERYQVYMNATKED